MGLSLCMIVRNEAENLPQCLESVRSLVDEQIILDTGSTDDTVAIAQSLGATVAHFPWNGNFSDARNEALRYVTQDWVLVLDADETLVEEAVPLIQQAIQAEDVLVVNLLRHEVGATQSPYSLVSRLFRRHPDIHFNRPYHALIDDSVLALMQREPQWKVVDLPGVAVRHVGYEPVAIAQQDKAARARAAMEGYLAQHPDDVYGCSKLGALYVQEGDIEKGIQLLKQGLQIQEKQSSPNPMLSYELHYHLGIALSRQDNPELALSHYRVALKQPIGDRLKLGALINIGTIFKQAGQLDQARQCYQRCVDSVPDFALGHFNLGTTLRAMGKPKEAIAHYHRAIELEPNHAEVHQNLGVALLKLGRVRESLESFRQAVRLHETSNPQEAERIRQSLQEIGFEV